MKKILLLLFAITCLIDLQSQTIIGKSSYDVQTNNGAKNRIKVYDDGSISTIWTGSVDYISGTTWADRGMFYNHFDGTSWGALPTVRIEEIKTGFGELITVEDHEVVLAHNGAGPPTMNLYANDEIGGTTWTELDGSYLVEGYWPMAECPSGTDDIYVVHANANPPTALYFSRSDDGGNTWAVLNYTLPYLTADYGFPGLNTGSTTAAETYQIKVNGADVYVLFGLPNSDLILLHSDDYGNDGSWDYEVIIDFPFDSYTGTEISDIDADGVMDTIKTNDGYIDMIMEDDGTLHVFAGYTGIYSATGAFSYTYSKKDWGLWHWKTGMDAAEKIETIMDWNNDDCADDPNAGIGALLSTYRFAGVTTTPAAAWDPATGRIYLLYTMEIEYTDIYDDPINFSAQSRRDIFGMYSDDGGSTWSAPNNLTNTAELDRENFYLFVNDRVYDGKVHAIWQEDGLPGTVAGEFDPIDTNYIYYQAFDESDFIPQLPTASFTTVVTAPSVAFTNTSIDNFNCYFWDFGDGTTSDFENPTHIYTSGGSFTACLTVSNPYGSNTSCMEIALPSAPEAFWSSTGDPLVTFTDLTANDPTSWSWNFGDGGSSTLQNPTHSYLANATYNVCLTASNVLGSGTYCGSVVISSAVLAPIANYTFSAIGLTVNFTDVSLNSPASWSWDFGDGSALSSVANPSHTFAAAGEYIVCLTTTNAAGSDEECKTIGISTAIDDVFADAVQIYPNPTSATFILHSPVSLQLSDIQIINTLGQTVSYVATNSDNNNWQITITQPQAGNYFLKLQTANGVILKQLILE